jgi:GNAT superfamily N-acetyltransferase
MAGRDLRAAPGFGLEAGKKPFDRDGQDGQDERMVSDLLRKESFAPDDDRMRFFEAAGARGSGPAASDPVSRGGRCLVAWRGDEPVARCSLQVVESLHGVPGRSGLIGHYEAADAEAGIALLRHAQFRLASADVERVLGPMNGSTWARYRLALPSMPGDPAFDPPVFMTEPQNPFDYPEQFAAAGFSVAARYESRIDVNPGAVRLGAAALRDRLLLRGITVRPLYPDRYDDELEAIFALSRAAFAGNLYYTPIDLATFRSMYLRLRPLIDPDLVRLAHDAAGRLVGFLFAFPDPFSAVDGRPTRVVAKTGATTPDARRFGIGMHLLDQVRELACEKGYQAVIHALMHVDNTSVKSSSRHESLLFRRYALYEWRPERPVSG